MSSFASPPLNSMLFGIWGRLRGGWISRLSIQTVARRIWKFKQRLFGNINLRTRSGLVYKTLPIGHGWSAPAENPFGMFRCQINTAVTVRFTVIVVPVGAVNRDAVHVNIGCPG